MEKVVPYTRFLSLLMMHNMKEGYGDGEVTPYSTQVFSIINWALKPNQPEEPLFTYHMLDICNTAEPMVFKAPKPSSNVERVPQGTKPGAKPGHKKHSTSSKQPSVSNKEAIKGRSSKAPTSSKTGHLKRKKESSLAIECSPPPLPPPQKPFFSFYKKLAVAEMQKEDQQATDGPTSLGVTSEARVNPRLNSVMSAFNLNEPMYLVSFIIHSESASGDDALAVSIAKADPGKFALSDFTKPNMLVKDWKLFLTQPTTRKGARSIARQVEEDEASRIIKLEDLAKLVSSVQPSFKDLDSPKDDPIIVVDDSDEDEEANEVHATTNVKTKDTSVLKSSSPKSSQIQELTNQVLILQSQKYKLELEKNKVEAEVALLKAQPSFPMWDNSMSFWVKKQVHKLEIELPGDLKEIPTKLEDFTKTITSLTSQVAELETLQWELPAEFLSVPSQFEMKLKKFDFITENGKHIHLTEEQINQQKKIEEEAKAEAAKQEGKVEKAELVDLLGAEVVNKYYNDKLQYDRYCDKMLNRRAESRITNCDVLTKKGPITLKVYREDGTSEVIPNFKAMNYVLGIDHVSTLTIDKIWLPLEDLKISRIHDVIVQESSSGVIKALAG
ncbi:hypothetical protein Tco_1575044 [Tanacetum coccineum]